MKIALPEVYNYYYYIILYVIFQSNFSINHDKMKIVIYLKII